MPEDQTMELFAALLRSGMGDHLVPEAVSFLDMLAEDAIMEFPFAPPGLPQCLDGKVAIRNHVENLGHMIQLRGFSSSGVHRFASGFVLEFTCTGTATQTGRPYNQEYVSVITLREGRIVRYRDYWNPLHVLDAMKPADGTEKEPA
jgi:ketosteroid isomerase-like protein